MSIELRLTNLNEIDVLELQNAINFNQSHDPISVTTEASSVPSGTHGDPGTVTALIMILAPKVIPVVAAAVAAWIAKGRKGSAFRGRKLTISRGGISISNFSFHDFQETSSVETLKAALTNALKPGAGD